MKEYAHTLVTSIKINISCKESNESLEKVRQTHGKWLQILSYISTECVKCKYFREN
jgi:hypothetical protein